MAISEFQNFEVKKILKYKLKNIFWNCFPPLKTFLGKTEIYVIDTTQISSSRKSQFVTCINGKFMIFLFLIQIYTKYR